MNLNALSRQQASRERLKASTRFYALVRSMELRERHVLELPPDVVRWLATRLSPTDNVRRLWSALDFPLTIFGRNEDIVGFQCADGVLWAWLQTTERLLESAAFCSFAATSFTKRGMSAVPRVALVLPNTLRKRSIGGKKPGAGRRPYIAAANGHKGGGQIGVGRNDTELSRRRVSLGLSQYAVGKKVGVTAACIAHWESGRQKPSNEHLRLKYAAALELL